MNERLVRIGRLLDARKKVVERVEVELAQAVTALAASNAVAEAARATWLSAATATDAAECSPADLADLRAYARTLSHRYDETLRAVRAATSALDACDARARVARIEVRKVELWRDRIVAVGDEQARYDERRSMDELASRTTRIA